MRATLWSLALLGASLPAAHACTTYVAGKKATVDGSVLGLHTNDGEGELVANTTLVPAADWPAGSIRKVPEGKIPQVPHTYAYTISGGYGTMNEWQVGISESTTSGYYLAQPPSAGGHALLDMYELTKLGLERGKTAREVIKVMGELGEKYGFWGNGDAQAAMGESGLVSDADEAWVFHITPDSTRRGAIWGAQRVPDDHVAAVANCFTIHGMNISDTGNFLASSNIVSEAKLRGWDASKPLDFSLYFSFNEYKHKYYSGRRVWGVYRLLAPSQKFSPYYDDYIVDAPYPFSIKPDKLLGIQDLTAVSRDHYEGTEFDQTKGLAAGPFGSPNRWTTAQDLPGWWERTIAIHRTNYVTIVQSRSWLPRETGAIQWAGAHAADTNVLLPLAMGMDAFPWGVTLSTPSVDRTTAWWVNLFLLNFAESRYSYMIQDIRALQNKYEAAGVELVAKMDALYAQTKDMAAVTKAYSDFAAEVIAATAELGDNLVAQYQDGFCNGCGKATKENQISYPEAWLKAVGFDHPAGPTKKIPPYTPTVEDSKACIALCPEAAYKECVASCLAGL